MIPLEMLWGLLIWILITRIVGNEKLRISFLLCIALVALIRIHIPDWGHAKMEFGEKIPFLFR